MAVFDYCGNFSVRTKVALVMAGVLAAAALLGLFAVRELWLVNANAAEIRDDWLPSTRVLGDLNYAVTRVRSAQSTSLMQDPSPKQEKQVARAQKLEQNVQAALDKYVPMISSAEERAMANRIQAAWNAYQPMYATAQEKLKTEGRQAAADFFTGPSRDAFDELNKAITEDIAMNNAGGIAAADSSAKTFRQAQTWIFIAIGVTLLLCAAATWALTRCVSRPLVEITGAMGELAAGHLTAEVPHADRRDEIGQLAEAMTTFKNQLASAERAKAVQTELIVSSVGTGLDRLSKGDLGHRISADLTGPFRKLKDDFNATVSHLSEMVQKILSTSSQITTGAGEISQAADDLSRRTEQQAASLEETAAALEEIAATMKKTASNTREVDGAITTATAAAKEGGHVVESATKAMDAIAQSSREITDIIGVIDEIAFQTNLLALNAGVEAARAGEAGKGFAVVASEVRALAGRSGEAAKKIKALIHTAGENVAGGVKLVGESGQALKRIVDQVQQISALVSEMAGAAEQQSSGIQQVNAAVGQMDQVTQQNAAMVEQSTAASRNLAHETQVLQELVSFFQVETSSAAAVHLGPAQPQAKALSTQLHPPAAMRRSAAAVPARKMEAAPADDWTEF
nr:methyl-accepting chemotaxis protein [Rhizomicrobium electricum]